MSPGARIFKAVKGGKRRDESPMQFFERLKTLGFDGVESGSAKDASAYRVATAKTVAKIPSAHRAHQIHSGPAARDDWACSVAGPRPRL